MALSLNSLTKVESPSSCIWSTITAHVSLRMRVCVKDGKMPPVGGDADVDADADAAVVAELVMSGLAVLGG